MCALQRDVLLLILFILPQPQPRSTLFPYTTLFRSHEPQSRSREPQLPRRVTGTYGGTRPFCPRVCHGRTRDRKSTRLNSSHQIISYAVFCLKKKTVTPLARRAHPHPTRRRAPVSCR